MGAIKDSVFRNAAKLSTLISGTVSSSAIGAYGALSILYSKEKNEAAFWWEKHNEYSPLWRSACGDGENLARIQNTANIKGGAFYFPNGRMGTVDCESTWVHMRIYTEMYENHNDTAQLYSDLMGAIDNSRVIPLGFAIAGSIYVARWLKLGGSEKVKSKLGKLF